MAAPKKVGRPSVKEEWSIRDMAAFLESALHRQALEPNLLAYKPHPKQEAFHKSTAFGRWFLGGNRSGKSVAGVVEDLWWATKRHPYHRIDSHLQIRGRVVGVDFTNGCEGILFPIFKRWLVPSDLVNGSWEDSYNRSERTLFFADGSFIEFKSSDQDLDKHAGTSRHFIHFDEEPPKLIFDENLLRIVDTGGKWWLTMTPVNGMCVDEKTELLSMRGWLKWNEIRPGEPILTHQGWKRIKAMYIDPEFKGDMHSFGTSANHGAIDARATAEHKWLTQRGLVPAAELRPDDKLQLTVEVDSLFPELHSEEFCELIGWVIGDGSVPKDSGTKVVIYQSESLYPENCARIRELVNVCGGSYFERSRTPGSGNKIFGIQGELGRDIRRIVGLAKVLQPQWVASLSKGLLRALLRGLEGSDGTTRKSGTFEITTVREDHKDMYEMIGVLAGHRVSSSMHYYGPFDKQCFKVRYWLNKQEPTGADKVSKGHYDGLVWCPNTEAGTFVARRNGSIYLTGNTWVYDQLWERVAHDEFEPADPFPVGHLDIFEVEMDENPHLSLDAKERALMFLDADTRKKREKGLFVPRGGRVFKEYYESTHFQKEAGWRPPKSWKIYTSTDYGMRNPTAHLYHAVHPDGFPIVTFHEFYGSDTTIKEWAKLMLDFEREEGLEIYMRTGDPNMKQRMGTGSSVLAEYWEEGIQIGVESVPKDPSIGIERMTQYFSIDPKTHVPYWTITQECPAFNKELKRLEWESYASPKLEDRNNPQEKVHKKNDHAFDSAKYFATFMPDLRALVTEIQERDIDTPWVQTLADMGATVSSPDNTIGRYRPTRWETQSGIAFEKLIGGTYVDSGLTVEDDY